MMHAYSSACRVLAGVNPTIPNRGAVSRLVARDLNWHADTPNELGDSGEDPITIAELRTMTLHRMRKVVLQKAKAVQEMAKSKFRELRAVDKTLLEQRDYVNAQANKWKADSQIHHFDKTIVEDPGNDGVHRRYPNTGNHDQVMKDLTTIAKQQSTKSQTSAPAPSSKKLDDLDMEKRAIAKLPPGALKSAAERQLEKKSAEVQAKLDGTSTPKESKQVEKTEGDTEPQQ